MGKKHKKEKERALPEVRAAATSTALIPSRLSGRTTIDSIQDVYRSGLRVLTPFSSDSFWRNYGLDQRTLDRVPIWKLTELLIDLSPDVSKGLWDWQRLFNPGYECVAYKVGGKEDVKDEKAQAALDLFLNSLHGPYSVTNQIPANVVINTVSMQAFLRGGMFAELVLDQSGRMPLEIVTPDPQTVRFQRVEDPDRGMVWQLGQYQGGGTGLFTAMDRPTVIYLPVDPLPGKPFGRPLIHPAIFATLFLIGLLHDLRRVVAQQGYPRLDLVIDTEKLSALMPTTLQGDPLAMKEWVTGVVNEIEAAYSKLQPDDAYVHMDVVSVNSPVGAASGSNLTGLTGIDGVIKSLEGMLTKALKTMPLMMGAGSTGGEVNANRQWEIQAAGIKAIQHLAENLFEKLLTIALQVQGIAAEVEVRFSELRAAEELRDQQVLYLKLRNARMAYDNGLISMDEQAQQALGKAKADQTEPRADASGAGGQVASINAEPGSQRLVPDATTQLESLLKEATNMRNHAAQALLFTANAVPSAEEVDDAERFFDKAVPDAEGILSAEPVN